MRAPRNVAVDLTPILPGGENGGAKIFAIELVKALAQLAPDTQFVLLTQRAAFDELAALEGPNVRRLLVPGVGVLQREQSIGRLLYGLRAAVFRRAPKKLAFLMSRIAARLIKRTLIRSPVADSKADLLFCPFTAPTLYEPGVPTVTTIHDVQYMVYPQFFAAEDAANRDLAIKNAFRFSAAIATISDHARATVLAHNPPDPERVRTIHHRMARRLENSWSNEDLADVLTKLGLERGQYLIYPANFWRHKNHEMLLTAFAMACHQGLPDQIRLVCTGAPGERRDHLMRLAARMQLSQKVSFPGHLAEAEFAALVSGARGLVFPSLFEGFGLPVVEAMALGVPVACSDVTSLPEIASGAALMFDPRMPGDVAAAIMRLATDDAAREAWASEGRRRAEQFSDVGVMAREYWDLFGFALENVGEHRRLSGIHGDGWAGAEITLELSRGFDATAVELDVLAPDWLPHAMVLLAAGSSDGTQTAPQPLARGERTTLRFDLPGGTGGIRIRITPSFVPSSFGPSRDHRELSVMIERCDLVLPQGDRLRLFPESHG
ncbi:MAG TPA: glycosyltransferase family 1 protein [Geminicoccus sp.]|jgi:glycosyltransferase involved in cell wall biosynthesis|uniref:glycosyltransferase family 4 protein n=1 Tax=Geminicoccus sp. TaxID=2024832 RepID=UPI002E36E686|nr:glycosyltransferase family 1 protein [Geminicoccus sp.]HEX2526396.1 glycosyltransferase family 1 protein [Geminicoccus sp.]